MHTYQCVYELREATQGQVQPKYPASWKHQQQSQQVYWGERESSYELRGCWIPGSPPTRMRCDPPPQFKCPAPSLSLLLGSSSPTHGVMHLCLYVRFSREAVMCEGRWERCPVVFCGTGLGLDVCPLGKKGGTKLEETPHTAQPVCWASVWPTLECNRSCQS